MPLVFLERFPWPSLQTYTVLSVVLLAGTLFSSYTTEAPSAEETQSSSIDDIKVKQADSNDSLTNYILRNLITDGLFVWVRIIHILNCSFVFPCMSRRIVMR